MFINKTSILIFMALISVVGLHSKLWGGDDSNPNQSTGSNNPVAVEAAGKNANNQSCAQKKSDYDNRQASLQDACDQLRSRFDENSNGTLQQCVQDATNCTTDPGYTSLMTQTNAQIISDLKSEDDGDPDYENNAGIVPTSTPKPPIPPKNSTKYCHPNGDSDTDDTSECAPIPPKGKSAIPKTACLQIGVQARVNYLDKTTTDDNSTYKSDQTAFQKSESELEKANDKCQEQVQTIQDQISQAQLRLKKAQTDLMTQVGGENVELTAKISDLQAKIDQATQLQNQINGPNATQILNDYNIAIMKAESDCRKNLVIMGQKNQLTTGSLSGALNISNVGLTQYTCQRDYDAQQARAAAWQTYEQRQQQNQVKFMQVQAQITDLQRQMITSKMGDIVKKNALANAAAEEMTNEENIIRSSGQRLSSAQTSCAAQGTRLSQQSNDAMASSDVSAREYREKFCQMKYLEKKCNVEPNGEKPDDKGLGSLDDLLQGKNKTIGMTNPCASEWRLDPNFVGPVAPGATPPGSWSFKDTTCSGTPTCGNTATPDNAINNATGATK